MHKIPSAVEYTTLTGLSLDDRSLSDVQKDSLRLQAQGRAVILPDKARTIVLVETANLVLPVSDELVLETDKGKFLIYDHGFNEVLRPKEIREDYVNWWSDLEVYSDDKALTNLNIDLPALLDQSQHKLEQIINVLQSQVKPAITCTIYGSTNPLLDILVSVGLFGSCKNLIYFDELGSSLQLKTEQ
jgi:hypothetical protein